MARQISNPQGNPNITWRGSFSLEQREAMIREAAYYRGERRGFAPGHDLEDWLAAEADIEGYAAEPGVRSPREIPEREIQQSGAHGAAQDDELKRIVKQHPQRGIPQIESVEPQDAPFKE